MELEKPDNPIDRYILAQTAKDKAKVTFLGQASGDAILYHERFHTAFEAMGQEHTHLSLFNPHTADIEGFLLSQDLIYVGGGNTKSMLALWREWNIDVILRKAAASGIAFNQGEVCTAGSRVLVERSIREQFIPLLVEALQAWKPGHALDPKTTVGAVVDQRLEQR